MKQTLVNTDLSFAKFLTKISEDDGYIGFDTEVAGPLLRGRDFTNITFSALLGLSVAFEDEECFYLPFRHKGNNISFVQLLQACSWLQRRTGERKVWAHNATFDHQVMIREGFPMVGLLDSMVAAWMSIGRNTGLGLKGLALSLVGRQSPEYDPSISHKTGAEVLDYACQDALNTLQIGMQLFPVDNEKWFYEECDFAYLLACMKLQGISIDRNKLYAAQKEGHAELDKLEAEWEKACPFTSISSSKQLQTLFEDGIWESNGTTATGLYKTGKDSMQYQLERGTPLGIDLAKLRLAHQEINKLVSTYTDGLIEESLQWADKKLHPDLHQFGTVTGRLSSSNPNIQNQPARGDWAAKVKSCFIPDPGMEFTSADYSQVELRYFANYCGGSLLKAFEDGEDLHQRTGDALGVDRQQGKIVNFAFLVYGGGHRKFAKLLDVPENEARRLLERLRRTYPEVEAWRSRVTETVSQRRPRPWCKTLAGRKMYIPELDPDGWERDDPQAHAACVKLLNTKYGWMGRYQERSAILSRGKRLVVNYLVQGGSRDLLVLGMNEYQRTIMADPDLYPMYSIVTTVHDEVLTQHPIGCGQEARALLQYCLEKAGNTLGLRVPIVAEPKTGCNWQEVK